MNGTLAGLNAIELGKASTKTSLEKSGLAGAAIEEVIFGNVLAAGLGQNPARQASLGAGLPPAVGATTVNKMCGSGLKAVMLGAQAIKAPAKTDRNDPPTGGRNGLRSAPLARSLSILRAAFRERRERWRLRKRE